MSHAGDERGVGAGEAVSRRGVLLGGLGLALAGCVSGDRSSNRWVSNGSGVVQEREGSFYIPSARRQTPASPEARAGWQPARLPTASPATASLPTRPGGPVGVVSRSVWTNEGPVAGRVSAMGGVRRITVHHEGWTPVYFDDASSVIDRLLQIRKVHVKDRGWGDIGYHYVVDRAGRVWEARPLIYQGAHAGPNGANRHNVGIMVLGNFDRQRPSDAQFGGLVTMLRWLCSQYRVPSREIYTHQELNPTACPGRVLQAQMVALRKHPELL
ncbi:MAG: peptidoglycan recognition family protein [Phycisphaeraceae bacterium]